MEMQATGVTPTICQDVALIDLLPVADALAWPRDDEPAYADKTYAALRIAPCVDKRIEFWMTLTDQASDWQTAITTHYEIAPTFNAMQRLLLFGLRSASVQSSEPTPGAFETLVEKEGNSWNGTGSSPEEAMGRALLAMAQSETATAEPAIS
jgi:hypothetical protein